MTSYLHIGEISNECPYVHIYIRDVHELVPSLKLTFVPSLKLTYLNLLYKLSLYEPTFSHYTRVEFAFICFASRNKLNKVLNHKPVQMIERLERHMTHIHERLERHDTYPSLLNV
jgi:hypothetical protein